MTGQPPSGLAPTVEAAQLAAGVLAARHRRLPVDVGVLMAALSPEQLTAGALLLAELSIGLYAREVGQDVPTCLSQLCLDLEAAVG